MTHRTECTATRSRIPVWAAVPYKGWPNGKGRLAGVLAPEERAALSLAMLADVVDALRRTPDIERVLIVTSDADAVATVAVGGIEHVPEHDEGGPDTPIGLNAALTLVQRQASRGRAGRLLVVPADVPLVAPDDLTALLAARLDDGRIPDVTLAPDGVEDGTNALLLTPPECITPRFGVGSFAMHQRLAYVHGRSVVVVRRPNLARDVDRPTDLIEIVTDRLGVGRAVEWLRRAGIAERLRIVHA
ncbi:MAG: 2-phospho-L-lactate guanylyltransferase [Chloroflexi bacterium]|nr:2-phospho-L-lactate guanylyltransferase [Chloroflexota bacterium]